MSNNKQSSVEQFAIALYEGGFLQGNGDEINDLLERHKAMHKEEMEHFFKMGMSLVEGHLWKPIDKFEECHEQTFNTKEK